MIESLGVSMSVHSPDYAIFADFDRLHGLTEALGERSMPIIATAMTSLRDVMRRDDFPMSPFRNPVEEALRSLTVSTRLLASAEAPADQRAIERSILLTDAELRMSENLLNRFDVQDLDVTPVSRRRLLVPGIQRQQLRRRASAIENLELDDLLAAIPIGQAIQPAQEILSLIADINEERVAAGDEPMFKLTVRLQRVITELPQTAALDRSSFADFIDYLYWLFYEAAGTAKLRYHTDGGGPLNDTTCSVVFFVKRLRNFFRHDLEHGSDRDIAKKFADVHDDLVVRGLERLPRTREEYLQFQRNLLEEALAFVRVLRESI